MLTTMFLFLFLFLSLQICFSFITMKGMTFTNDRYCSKVKMGSSKAERSLDHMADVGVNYVAIVVTWWQSDINSTTIHRGNTVTDNALISTINYVRHKHGMRVLLKPHVDLTNDSAHWRGQIGTHFSASDWNQWFQSYDSFILRYAKLASQHAVEMFSVSTELVVASNQEMHWRGTVRKIRNVYSGVLTDAADDGGEEFEKKWWDVIDVIGIDAYYEIYDRSASGPPYLDTTALMKKWAPYEKKIVALQAHENKSVIFTELGYCGGVSNRQGRSDVATKKLQADLYEAALRVFGKYQWFQGIFWWNWNTDPYFGGCSIACMDPKFNPAEAVLRKYYGAAPKYSQCAYPPGNSTCDCFL